jgi:uncharacterized 2Fe-2S/4Fe-4S cluster protein (DUF4445 family)
MTKYKKVIFQPGDEEVIATHGDTIMDAAQKGGLILNATCGGRGTCGKCKVKVEGPISEPTKEEQRTVGPTIDSGVRLACQARILGDIRVTLDPEAQYKILTKGMEEPIRLAPSLSKIYLDRTAPSLKDQRPDLERLIESLGVHPSQVSLEILKALPGILRRNDYKATAILNDNKLMGIEGGDTTERLYGVAFDIGTTTVVGTLMDLNTGHEIATSSSLNLQASFGADVISRIDFANREPEGLKILQDKILRVLNSIIGDLTRDAGISPVDIYQVVVVGNTCMQHLLLGVEPKSLAEAPYVPVFSSAMRLSAKELELNISPWGMIYMLPAVAGFVGADTVGVSLATSISRGKAVRLVVDIGTNGEILLGSSQRLVAASTAAGPAFEGAEIKFGMRGATGAIEAFQILNGEVKYKVIGDVAPKGICGSGLIDILAELLRLGIIDKNGRIMGPDEISQDIPYELKKRIVEGERGYDFVITFGEGGTPDIFITQGDVRKLQVAKAAIYAGIEVLKSHLGVRDSQISQVLLAGAFGNYIRKESAKAIGLIPDVSLDKINSVGNAAGAGAKMVLLSKIAQMEGESLAKSIEYIELATSLRFQERFVDAMYFP